MAAIKYALTRVSIQDQALGLRVGDIVMKATKQINNPNLIICVLPDRLKGKGHRGSFTYGAGNYWYFTKNQLEDVTYRYES